MFWEHVGPEDFDAEHFRRCIADRIGWAVADAAEAERDRRFTSEGQTTAAPVVNIS